MISKKVKILLISYVALVSVLVLLEFFTVDLMNPSSGGFTNFTPFSQYWSQLLWIMVLWILGNVFGVLIGGYVFGPVFLFLHKITIGRKMIYGVQDKQQGEKYKRLFIKTLFPALLAVNLCLNFSYNPGIQNLILVSNSDSNIMNVMLTFSSIAPLISGFSIAIFAPSWFLLDGGIVYSNKKKVEKRSDPEVLRSVGGWFLYLLKGYAGISIVISYYEFLIVLFQEVSFADPSTIMIVIFWPIMPFLIAFLMLGGVITLDKTFNKRRKYMRSSANKLGISKTIEEALESYKVS
ncbi:MAG: hypothetical protein ACXACX_22135 [Candidatus Hodarchaeales archaeon]